MKNDVRDAADLADLLRMGRLPEAYIATPHERELRELVRHRAKLFALRSGLKAQVHATLAKQGQLPAVSDVFGRAGMAWLRSAPPELVYRQRIDSLLELIDAYDGEIECFPTMIANRFTGHRGYRAIQQISGIGPTFAAFVAEIGDVTRFSRPEKLCCWAGLTPRHRESDTTVHRRPITNRVRSWCVGPQSRPANTPEPAPSCRRTVPGSLLPEVATSGSWPRRADCSPWSSTACATVKSARCREGRVSGFGPGRARGRLCHDPRPACRRGRPLD